ncbi:YrdB family protein [Microbacterium chocolatum]|uniref:YrdB family protein n=1 Tax=Microbacterium aurantiacum TaxID=162393 RepID=UPI00338EF2FA
MSDAARPPVPGAADSAAAPVPATAPSAAAATPAPAPAAASAPGELPAGTRAPLSAVDLLAFACELFAFVTLAIWGFAMWPLPWNIVVGIGAPVAAILVWALFVSPRAVVPVHPFVRGFVELLVYASATVAWWGMEQPWVGVIFAVIAVTVGVISGRRRLA